MKVELMTCGTYQTKYVTNATLHEKQEQLCMLKDINHF